MLYAYSGDNDGLTALPRAANLAEAVWIDLLSPMDAQRGAVEALGSTVPTLADMEEIEISNRIWRHGAMQVLTLTLPGLGADGSRMMRPVCFVITPDRLVTVRYHTPRPFETFVPRAASSAAGCDSPLHIFLGLMEEIIARLADLMEAEAAALTRAGEALFNGHGEQGKALELRLRDLGQRGMSVGNHRLALLSLERALIAFDLGRDDAVLTATAKARLRDVRALIEHSDFLTGRAAQLADVTLGLVNLEQTNTGRIVSVIAALFLPPTLVASIYGMNFDILPGIHQPHGYLIATGLMLGFVLAGLLYFRWKKWL